MRLVAVDGLAVLVLDPATLVVSFAGRGDDRGVHQRAGLDPDRLGPEQCGHGFKQRTVEAVGDEQSAIAHKGGAFGGRLVACKAGEAAERGLFVESLGQLDVGQVVPDRPQQRPENATGGQTSSPLKAEFGRQSISWIRSSSDDEACGRSGTSRQS